MTTLIRTLLSSLCLCLAAESSRAELIDHFNPRWKGSEWKPNELKLALAYQQALYPLVTQGPGVVQMPSGAYVLRLSVCVQDKAPDQRVMTFWGKVTDPKETPLATLQLKDNKLVLICPVNPKGDSLFDARARVELESRTFSRGTWATFDLLVNPGSFQQTFGWNLGQNRPADPARTHQAPLHMARQLSPAAWEISKLELEVCKHVWLGQLELLPADIVSSGPAANIIVAK